MQYCPMSKKKRKRNVIIMYIIYHKVFGGTPNIFMFWLFPENGSITVKGHIIVHTTLYNSALTKNKNI